MTERYCEIRSKDGEILPCLEQSITGNDGEEYALMTEIYGEKKSFYAKFIEVDDSYGITTLDESELPDDVREYFEKLKEPDCYAAELYKMLDE